LDKGYAGDPALEAVALRGFIPQSSYEGCLRAGHRRLLFLLLKFPQNHTIFEEKTNHKGE
jgi:hypothetical protein